LVLKSSIGRFFSSHYLSPQNCSHEKNIFPFPSFYLLLCLFAKLWRLLLFSE
jgi:hypothetical protein